MNLKLIEIIQRLYKIVNILPFNNSVNVKKTKIINNGAILFKCKILSRGENTIIFHTGAILRNTTIHIYGNKNIVEIGARTRINHGDIYIEDDCNRVVVGSDTNICGYTHLACTEGKQIIIGNNCLFSSEIVCRTGDSHSIVDMSGERINQAADIYVYDHVWVGYRVSINKGVVIPKNTVIGTGSIITKSFKEENVILAGIPAKIVKYNINWKIERC